MEWNNVMMPTHTQVGERRWTVSTFEAEASPLEALLRRFDPITLAEMDRVALLDRVDTKYVMGLSQLIRALGAVTRDYRVLDVNGVRLNQYQTVYFDTPEFALYHQHHNGLGSRYKVRERKYVDSDLSFLEVKHKTNRGRTVKSRMQIPDVDLRFRGQETRFVDATTPLDDEDLEPKLWNEYLRMTLVSKRRDERLTLDVDLTFSWGDDWLIVPGIAIAEVKQPRFSQDSDFIRQMRRMGVRPTGFSKYCVGASLLYGELKANNFKQHVRLLQKVLQGEVGHERLH